MVDRLIRSKSRVRPSHGLRQPRMPSCEPLDVEFVNDRLVPRRARTAIITPCECGIDDRGQHRERCVVATVEREVFFGILDAVSVDLVAPANVPPNRPGVWLEHDFIGIEPVPVLRSVWTVHPVAIQLARQDARDVAVPDEVGLLRQRDASGLARTVGRVEQAQLHFERVLGEDRKVDAGAVPGCAERIG